MDLDIPRRHPFRMQIRRPDLGNVHSAAQLRDRPGEYAFYIARYDAGIYAMDEMVRRMLAGARERGALKNTIVAFVGDHGEALVEHNYYFAHGRFPYDDCMKVPMLIRPVGGGKHRRVREPVPAFALAPTLLEMVAVEPPAEMEAGSLLGVISGAHRAGYVFSESGYQLQFNLTVRDGRWKLTHIPNEIDRSLLTGSEYELYNVRIDPGELNNLCDREPVVARRLKEVLEDWSEPWIHNGAYDLPREKKVHLDPETIEELRSLGYVP
jgi:arylsulfatase A-like enzyme